MARNVFSVPIFFIVFRETLEAAIIVSVLLGLVEQIVHEDPSALGTATESSAPPLDEKERVPEPEKRESEGTHTPDEERAVAELPAAAAPAPAPGPDAAKRLVRRMRIQIFAGALLGLFVALAIGAAFIAVWFTQAADLWAKSEELWEGAPRPAFSSRFLSSG